MKRTGSAAGVIAVIVLGAAIVFESLGPTPTDSAARIARVFADDQAGVMAASLLLMVGIVLYLVFLTVFTGILQLAEGGSGRMSLLALVGWVASFAMTAVYIAIYASLAHRVAVGAGANVTFALFRVATAIDSIGNLFFGIAIIAASLAILKTDLFRSWLGWLGCASGGLFALGSAALDDPTTVIGLIGLLGVPLTFVWTIAISLAIWRMQPHTAAMS